MRIKFTLLFLLITIFYKAQPDNLKVQDTSIVVCPNNMIYVEPAGGMYSVPGNPITVYDPAFPIGSGNPAQIGISMPNGWGGLALGPNINSSTVGTTFYTQVYNSSTSKGDIKYWNGSSWVFTGHSFPTPNFINLGMGGNYLYGLSTITASMGMVYKYDGTSNPVYLTTVNGWNNGGPFDLSVDCNGNWSILKADGPQWLRTYDPSGNLLTQYSVTGLPISSQGGGLAILNNKVYAHSSGSLAVGTISGSNINFTTIPWSMPLVSDFAVCPDCSLSTGIINKSDDIVRIYPNPASDEIRISALNGTDINISIYNYEGQLIPVQEINNSVSEITIRLPDKIQGLFRLVIKENNGKLILTKTIILNN